jgi:ribosome-associated translation inhibitor RaiA
MQLPLQVSFRHMEPSDAIEAAIRERAATLDTFAEHIMSCRVVVEPAGKHHLHGNLYEVRIDLTVPGEEIAVTREPSQHSEYKDIHVALRDAFDSARRKLEDYARRRRGSLSLAADAHRPPPHLLCGCRRSGALCCSPQGPQINPGRQDAFVTRPAIVTNAAWPDALSQLVPASWFECACLLCTTVTYRRSLRSRSRHKMILLGGRCLDPQGCHSSHAIARNSSGQILRNGGVGTRFLGLVAPCVSRVGRGWNVAKPSRSMVKEAMAGRVWNSHNIANLTTTSRTLVD